MTSSGRQVHQLRSRAANFSAASLQAFCMSRSMIFALRGQVDQDEPPPVGRVVDGEGTGDEPGDSDGVEPVDHPQRLEDGEVAALPGERSRDAGHGYSTSAGCALRRSSARFNRAWTLFR